MVENRVVRWAAASGYLVVALGVAGAAFERGAPSFGAPDSDVVAFFTRYRTELLTQSVLFVLSAGVNVWFLAGLRSYLLRFEGGTGMLSTLAFAAGVLGVGISTLLHAPQIALAVAADGGLVPGVAGVIGNLGFVLSMIAYVPMAVMLAAVAAVSLRTGALPTWLAWLSVVGAVAQVVGWFGVVVTDGPLVPGGVVTYLVYLLLLAWLVCTTTVMVRRLGRSSAPVGARDRIAVGRS